MPPEGQSENRFCMACCEWISRMISIATIVNLLAGRLAANHQPLHIAWIMHTGYLHTAGPKIAMIYCRVIQGTICDKNGQSVAASAVLSSGGPSMSTKMVVDD